MVEPTHYETLNLKPNASQDEIKQSYRRLAKLFHPDSNQTVQNHDRIAGINAAYEILSDPQRRRSYDRELSYGMHSPSPFDEQDIRASRQQRTATAQRAYRQRHKTGRDSDEELQLWMMRVYQPVNRLLCQILKPLRDQIDDLAADPFDDELLEDFQFYLETCREKLQLAQSYFSSMPNPATVAGVAAHLYYCLSQVGDGIDELERFTYSYDDHYLHTGQELFRIAGGLRREAQAAIRDIGT